MTHVGAIATHLAALLISGLPIARSQVDHARRGRIALRLPEQSEANPYLALGELIEVRLKTLQAEVAALQMAVLHDQRGAWSPRGPRPRRCWVPI